jgi:hypothetical protein
MPGDRLVLLLRRAVQSVISRVEADLVGRDLRVGQSSRVQPAAGLSGLLPCEAAMAMVHVAGQRLPPFRHLLGGDLRLGRRAPYDGRQAYKPLAA